jgi:hypothetical protein
VWTWVSGAKREEPAAMQYIHYVPSNEEVESQIAYGKSDVTSITKAWALLVRLT